MKEISVPVINPDYLVEQFDNEVVLFSLNGADVVALNQTAHLVWRLCHENLTVQEIIGMLVDTYPDQAEEIRTDVLAALETMVGHNIIELANGG
ncbi:MAG: PqqD family protein [Desulfofustis sp.]|nr:PqqD family protein [Desulfofustis sp.]